MKIAHSQVTRSVPLQDMEADMRACEVEGQMMILHQTRVVQEFMGYNVTMVKNELVGLEPSYPRRYRF